MNTMKMIRNRVSQLTVGMMTAFALTLHSFGADGTWTNLAGGAWSATGNWAGGTVAAGTNAIADFSTLNITANAFVNNDAARTVGTLRFGDNSTVDRDWTLTNSTLTLATSSGLPTIDVRNRSVTIGTALLGTQGFCKIGPGQLNIDQNLPDNAIGSNTYSGGTYILAGTLMFGTYNKSGITGMIGPGTVYLGDISGSENVVLQPQYGSYSFANNIVLQSGNTGTMQINNNGGWLEFNGTITLGSASNSGKSLTFGRVLANSAVYISGGIQDPVGMTPGTAGTVTVNSTGYLVARAASTYSGATVIGAGGTWQSEATAGKNGGLPPGTALTVNGTLDMATSSISIRALTGTSGIIKASGAAGTTMLTVTQSVDTTFSGVIQNGTSRVVAVTKTGSGTLTLAGRNTYSGATTVNGGGFIGGTGGSCVNSTLTVAAGATNGIKAVEYGGQWACAGLTYTGGIACLDFDLTTLPLSTAFAPLIVNGDLSVTGTVDVVVRNGYWPVTGIYPLVSYSGNWNGSGSFNLASLPAGVIATLVNNTGAKRLDLNVTTVPSTSQQTSVWTNLVSGNASGVWGTVGNWTNGVPNGTDAIADFSTLNLTANAVVNNDATRTVGTLRFGDTTPSHDWKLTNSTLTLATSLGLPTIDVRNRSVTIGTALLGTQGFCKTGPGQLNIDQNLPDNGTGLNTYSGGTYILAGTLMFGTYNKNTITGMIGPGTVYLGDISGSENVVLQPQYGSYLLTNNIVLMSGNTGIMQIKNNGGWMEFTGTITLGKAYNSGKSLTFGRVAAGSAVYISRGIQDPVGMTPGTAGTVTVNSTGYLVARAASTYSGATVIDAGGTWQSEGSWGNFGNGGLPPGTALTVNGTLDMGDSLISIGALTGTGIVDRTYNGGSARVLTVGSKNTSTLFSGLIRNSQLSYPVSFIKTGSGVLTLSGTNTYTGTTAVSNGTLAVSGALSSSGVTVCTGAAFAAGSTGVVGRATLAGTLTFQNNSRLLVDVASITADAVSAVGNVTLTGTVTLEVSGDQTRGGSWKVLESTGGTITGNFVLAGARSGSFLAKSADNKEIWLNIPRPGTMIRIF